MEPDKIPLLDNAVSIVREASQKKVTLRIMGAMAVLLHSERSRHLFKDMKRTFTDIDLIGYSSQFKLIKDHLANMGYQSQTSGYEVAVSSHGKRSIYSDPKTKTHVDIFYDRLEMCHTVDFKNRLELDYPTISLADLLLEKMQIVHLNNKDMIDTLVMLSEHDIGDSNAETIDIEYVSRLLAKDWGFYYTVTTNLKNIKNVLGKLEALAERDKKNVDEKIEKAIKRIEEEPKSAGWKIRSKIGPSKKWYNDVEEVVR